MSSTALRDADLKRFDEARDAFKSTIDAAPNEALGYLKEGDDYALGGLLYHVNAVLVHYGTVLDSIVDAGFDAVTPEDPPGLFEEANSLAKAGLDANGRARE